MVYCSSCAKNTQGDRDSDGFLSCSVCGKVLTFENFSTEATFVKNSAGQSQVAGRLVRSIEEENFSRDRLYDRAHEHLMMMKDDCLGMEENMALVDQAMTYYRIAVERGFTRGRRTDQVEAVCLYIACRENRRPFLLIDFSNYLHLNIYVLGAVFLQLCKELNLTEHPICQKLLDPSMFIHKYTAKLAGGKSKEITDAALSIIASMNRDWMQTGRRPSGLWGAALYIAALAHGIQKSKIDILRLVHVCEATLSKRLVEFENTESGSLTIEELNEKAEELKGSPALQPSFGSKTTELLCQHKGSRQHFACGLCEDCYAIVIGFEGGSDPPAFQRAEKQRTDKLLAMEKANDENLEDQHTYREDIMPSTAQETAGISTGDLNQDSDERWKETEDGDESDNFSDIDDAEVNKLNFQQFVAYVEHVASSSELWYKVNGYLHSEQEKAWKKVIWEELNREYLEEQAEKEAAAAAAKEACEANLKNCSGDLQAAKDLDAAVSAATAKKKKERQQKRAADARNATPAQSASEAFREMAAKKKLGSKVNFDVVNSLFADEPSSKKQRTDSDDDGEAPLKSGTDLGTIDEVEDEGVYNGDNNEDDDDDEENTNPDLEYDW
ncbi:Transcription factor IIIB 90 kDa subunit [Linum perenne]